MKITELLKVKSIGSGEVSNLDWFGNWVYNIGSVKEKPGRIGRE